jgi:hypothetical protein
LIDVIAAFGASNLSLVVSQFLTGRWLVRRAPHRELPACGAYWVVGIAVGAAFFVALLQYGAIERTDLAMQPMVSLASNAFLFLGIARQKAVRVG